MPPNPTVLAGPTAFFVLNLVLFFVGLYLLTTGANLLNVEEINNLTKGQNPTEDFTKQLKLEMMPGAKIIAGVGMFFGGWLMLTGFLGMAAALLGLRLIYMMFLNLLVMSLLLWLCYIFAARYIAANAKDVHQLAKFTFEFGLRFEYRGDPKAKTGFEKMVDGMQVELDCCGMDSYKEFRQFAVDWLETEDNLVVPPSCCLINKDAYKKKNIYVLKDVNCTSAPTSKNSHIGRPCFKVIEKDFNSKNDMFVLLATAITILLIVLIVLGAFLLIRGGGILAFF